MNDALVGINSASPSITGIKLFEIVGHYGCFRKLFDLQDGIGWGKFHFFLQKKSPKPAVS